MQILSEMSRYKRDWLETHIRQNAMKIATFSLREKENDLACLVQRKLDLELNMQHLHLAAAAGNEELKKREEATAKAIAADELEDSYSEDEYVRDRKIEKPTIAAVKRALGKEEEAGEAAKRIADQLVESSSTVTNLQTLIARQVVKVNADKLAHETADRLAVKDRLIELEGVQANNPNDVYLPYVYLP